MNEDKSYSSISRANKMERLIALVENRKRRLRKKVDNTSSKARVEKCFKRKLQNSHYYKKLFARREKMKDVNDIMANNSCSGSSFKKQRSCSAQGSGEITHQSHIDNKIECGGGELPEKDDQVISYVNKLHDFWNKGQNAVVFDGQERLVKVVRFVLSLLDNMKNDVLILACPSALLLWEIEFSEWSKSMNVVTYKGNKDKRAVIRNMELYGENGCKILLSSPDAIVEDMDMFDHIKWGLLVIDECQRRTISSHFNKLKMLMADMKLVTVSGESGDIYQAYINILSLFDCKYKRTCTASDKCVADETNTLKEILSPFIAFECKFDTCDLEEYWVPVHLSSLQIMQYCSILTSSFGKLSSSSKKSSHRDIITKLQKCCDHPCLVDPSLRYSLTDPDAEINVSGKMQLLNKLLQEIKRYGLRVLVLFQSGGTEKISTASMLDDFVKKRFGESSYVHIPKNIKDSLRAKKRKLIEMFNHTESERFICLCDYNSCHSSITLSRVDEVILFNSDVNPLNDIKNLKRITFDSPCEKRLNVFRLYPAFTVEEKALILSKQGSTVNRVYLKAYRQMVAWGASYLFNKNQSCIDSEPLSFIDDLVDELSYLLKKTSVETGPMNQSMISKAEMQNGVYSGSVLLVGETKTHNRNLIDKNTSAFWRNLVKQSHCRPEKPRSRLDDGIRNDATTSSVVMSKPRSKRKAREKDGRKWGETTSGPFGSQHSYENVTEECTRRDSLSFDVTDVKLPIVPSTSMSDSVSLNPTTNGGQQGQSDQPQHTSSPSPLETEMERIQKELEQITKSYQEQKSMMLSECEKEIYETRKKYDALIHESEMSLTREIKILENYQKLVDAHKLLAEILSQNLQDGFELNLSEHNLNPSELNLHRSESAETSSFNIPDIPASALDGD